MCLTRHQPSLDLLFTRDRRKTKRGCARQITNAKIPERKMIIGNHKTMVEEKAHHLGITKATLVLTGTTEGASPHTLVPLPLLPAIIPIAFQLIILPASHPRPQIMALTECVTVTVDAAETIETGTQIGAEVETGIGIGIGNDVMKMTDTTLPTGVATVTVATDRRSVMSIVGQMTVHGLEGTSPTSRIARERTILLLEEWIAIGPPLLLRVAHLQTPEVCRITGETRCVGTTRTAEALQTSPPVHRGALPVRDWGIVPSGLTLRLDSARVHRETKAMFGRQGTRLIIRGAVRVLHRIGGPPATSSPRHGLLSLGNHNFLR